MLYSAVPLVVVLLVRTRYHTLVAMRRVAAEGTVLVSVVIVDTSTDWYVHEKLVSQRSLLIFSVAGCIFFAMVWCHTRRKNSRGT
jgi:hypothetical protein